MHPYLLLQILVSPILCSMRLDIFSYSGPSGILCTGRKQNTALGDARGVRIVALTISSHDQTQ